ncbi:MAG: PAS domain-containing protein [Deltaproteobacteria bacterium]|nr:PAS domain-containing protein [Deltaproteobacteria bacterium]
MRLSIRSKVVLFVILPIVGIYMTVVALNIAQTHRWTISNVERSMTALAAGYADHFNGHLREAEQAAKLTAAFIENNPSVTSELVYAQLESNLKNNPLIYGSAVAFEPYKHRPDRRLVVRYVYRKDGVLRREDPSDTGYDYTEKKQEYWHAPRSTGKAVWTEPYFDEGGGNILMATYSVPCFRDEEFLGVATVDIPLRPLRELADLGLSETTDFFILTGTGRYVYSPQVDQINQSVFELAGKISRDDIIELAKEMISGKSGTAKIQSWDSEHLDWVFFAPIDSPGWGFAVSIPETTALSQVRQELYRNIAFLAVSLVFIVASLWFLTVAISRPIARLNAAVSEISRGNLSAKATVGSRDEIGELAGAFNKMAKDLSERQRDLSESEHKYRTLMENIPQRIFYKDRSLVYVSCNENFAGDLDIGAAEIAGKTDFDFFPKQLAEKYRNDDQRILESGNVETIEEDYVTLGGDPIVVQTVKTPMRNEDGQIIGLLGIFMDISDRIRVEEKRKELEAQIHRAEKMETVGTLAGGVAHDLNNILGGIVGYPDLLLDDLPADSSMRNAIMAIKKSGERAASVVQDLLTLTRRGVNVHKVVNLDTIVSAQLDTPESQKLWEIHPNTEIEVHRTSGLFNIIGSTVHLSKTIMNLMSNAAEAMTDGGKITISLENKYLDRALKGYDRIDEGEYVVLTVSDTGVGISQEDVHRIFEPFYTNKIMGRSGTGLGMAVVWGTVKDHDGYIDVKSEPGVGTTFSLYFPLTRIEVEDNKRSTSMERLRGRGNSILVVDDMQSQRDIASEILKKLGYKVECVSSGAEAVEHMKTHSADLLVLDMIMEPEMDGLDTYRAILATHPKQRAIVASGFSETDRVKEAQKLCAGAYVRKPYTIEDLGLAVKTELKNL